MRDGKHQDLSQVCGTQREAVTCGAAGGHSQTQTLLTRMELMGQAVVGGGVVRGEVVAGLVVAAAVVAGRAVVVGAIVVVGGVMLVVGAAVEVVVTVEVVAGLVLAAAVVLGAAVVVGVVAVVTAAVVTGDAVVGGVATVVDVTGIVLVGAIVAGTTATAMQSERMSALVAMHHEKSLRMTHICSTLSCSAHIATTQQPCNLQGHQQQGACSLTDIRHVWVMPELCHHLQITDQLCKRENDRDECKGGLFLTCTQADLGKQALLDLVCCINDLLNCKQQASL